MILKQLMLNVTHTKSKHRHNIKHYVYLQQDVSFDERIGRHFGIQFEIGFS